MDAKEEQSRVETLLQALGLTGVQARAYATLLREGTADARRICEAGGIPSSKVYEALDRLTALGLADVQPTRPRRWRALPVDQAVRALERSQRTQHEQALRILPDLEQQLRRMAHVPPSRGVFWSVALGWEEHLLKHLAYLAEAERELLVALDFDRIQAAEATLGPLVRLQPTERLHHVVERVREHIKSRNVPYKILVWPGGVPRQHVAAWVQAITDTVDPERVRQARAPVPSFYVVDARTVIVVIPNPARKGQALASLALADPALAKDCRDAFQQLWAEAEPLLESVSK